MKQNLKILGFILSIAGIVEAYDLKIINNSLKALPIELTSFQGIRRRRQTSALVRDLVWVIVMPGAAIAQALQDKYFGQTFDGTLTPHASLLITDILARETVKVGSGFWKTSIPLDQAQQLVFKNIQERAQRRQALQPGERDTVIVVVTPTRTGYSLEFNYTLDKPSPELLSPEEGFTTIEEEIIRIP